MKKFVIDLSFVVRTNQWDPAWFELHVVKVQIIITFLGTDFTSQRIFLMLLFYFQAEAERLKQS